MVQPNEASFRPKRWISRLRERRGAATWLLLALVCVSACETGAGGRAGSSPLGRYALHVERDADSVLLARGRYVWTHPESRIPNTARKAGPFPQWEKEAEQVLADMKRKADDFAAVTPPTDLANAHAQLVSANAELVKEMANLWAMFALCVGSDCDYDAYYEGRAIAVDGRLEFPRVASALRAREAQYLAARERVRAALAELGAKLAAPPRPSPLLIGNQGS